MRLMNLLKNFEIVVKNSKKLLTMLMGSNGKLS